jgi:acyl-CoA dehydrogenase
MFSLLTVGWLMARQALAAKAALDAPDADRELLLGKITTARFFGEQLLPAVGGLAPSVLAGATPLYDADLASLGG